MIRQSDTPRRFDISLSEPTPVDLEFALSKIGLSPDETLRTLRSVAESIEGLEAAIQELTVTFRRVDSVSAQVEAKFEAGRVNLSITSALPLEKLKLPPGNLQRLRDAGCETVEDVAGMNKESLESIPGIGPVSRARILRAVERLRREQRDTQNS